MSADISELVAWQHVLEAAGRDALTEGAKVVAKGSLNIKNEARELAPKGPHTPGYASSIRYDIRTGADWVEAETGPTGGGQARLGAVLEYGSPTSPPHPHHEPAADHEEPRFFAACEDLAEKLMARHG